MATKDLSRTVIEGGRRRYNKWLRRYSHGIERAAWRRFEAELRHEADDLRAPDSRPHVQRDFFDKLGPVRRWLRSFVGRPWSEAHALVFQKFDTRTLAGRHIVFDHLIREVDVHPIDRWGRFFVDANGILRERPRTKWRRLHRPPPSWAEEWIGARKIGERGTKAYWFVPVARGFDIFSYRQHLELDASELVRWRSLAPEHRALWQMELRRD